MTNVKAGNFPWSGCRALGGASARLLRIGEGVLGFVQDAFGRTLKIVILARAQRPEKQGKAEATQTEGERNQEQQRVHARTRRARRRRNAFTVTAREDAAMNSAAISGVTMPAMASGMAAAL